MFLTILTVSVVSAFWPFDGGLTGNVVNGDSSFCTSSNRCSYGQGDCDRDSQCIEGLKCVQDIAKKQFGIGSSTTDACVCPSGKTWGGDSCETTQTDTGSGNATISKCIDTDSGNQPEVAGFVKDKYGRLGVDYCKQKDGKDSVYEYVCDSKDIVQGKKAQRCELGCVTSTITSDGTTVPAGACIAPVASCTKIEKDNITIGAENERGEKFINGCGKGDDKLKYTTYQCDGSKVVGEGVMCATRCDNNDGCIGVCTETDSENNVDIGGVATLDGVPHPDVCIRNNRVKQYSCSNGRLKTIGQGDSKPTGCGTGKICVADETKGADVLV